MPTINTLYPSLRNKHLVPKSQYKGPVLQLTKEEEQAIQRIRDVITKYECDMYKLQRVINDYNTPTTIKEICIEEMKQIGTYIKNMQDNIKKIKVARIEAQRKEAGIK